MYVVHHHHHRHDHIVDCGAVEWAGAVGFTFHGCPTFNAGLATIRSNLEDTAKVIITIKGWWRRSWRYSVKQFFLGIHDQNFPIFNTNKSATKFVGSEIITLPPFGKTPKMHPKCGAEASPKLPWIRTIVKMMMFEWLELQKFHGGDEVGGRQWKDEKRPEATMPILSRAWRRDVVPHHILAIQDAHRESKFEEKMNRQWTM